MSNVAMRLTETILLDVGDLSAPPDTPAYTRAVHEKAKAALNDATTTREHIEWWVTALVENDRYQHLANKNGRHFKSWAEFCSTPQPYGLGYSPTAIDALLQKRPSVAERAEEPLTLLPAHRPTEQDKALATNTLDQRGESADYLTARIARDRPDILADMKAGKYKSVRAAALDAGIVKPRLSIPTDPTGAANAIIRNFNYDDLTTLINLLVEATQ